MSEKKWFKVKYWNVAREVADKAIHRATMDSPKGEEDLMLKYNPKPDSITATPPGKAAYMPKQGINENNKATMPITNPAILNAFPASLVVFVPVMII